MTQGNATDGRPRILVLCCGAGGLCVGLHRAGFDVWGVDIKHTPVYPFPLVVADALEVVTDRRFMDGFDAYAGTPPCQENTRLQHLRDAQGGTVKRYGHDLIGPLRAQLEATGKPWVMENVAGSSLRPDLTLCGTMFGLHVMRGDRYRPLKRHRLFESNVDLGPEPEHDHTLGRPLGVYGTPGDDIPQGGQTCKSVKEACELMGTPWMRRWDEVKEAVPPAYGEHVGRRLLAALEAQERAS